MMSLPLSVFHILQKHFPILCHTASTHNTNNSLWECSYLYLSPGFPIFHSLIQPSFFFRPRQRWNKRDVHRWAPQKSWHPTTTSRILSLRFQLLIGGLGSLGFESGWAPYVTFFVWYQNPKIQTAGPQTTNLPIGWQMPWIESDFMASYTIIPL